MDTLSFSLIVLLLTSAGQIDSYNFGPGLSREKCEEARAYAAVQLPQTLSNSIVFSIECVPHRGA